jgi:hypothetical protein
MSDVRDEPLLELREPPDEDDEDDDEDPPRTSLRADDSLPAHARVGTHSIATSTTSHTPRPRHDTLAAIVDPA